MLRFFICYMLVGQVLNWGTVFFVIWSVLRKCRGHDEVLRVLNKKYAATHTWPEDTSGITPKLTIAWRTAVNFVLWPRNVVNMLFHWSDEMKEADALLRSQTDRII